MPARRRWLSSKRLRCTGTTSRGALASLLLLSVIARAAPTGDVAPNTQEQWRPQFHFSPPAHWMNDPNGLVYAAGEYHLFYQYNPAASIWGPMHWGHAVSRDLLHWQHLPIALYPDDRGTIFSGSVVSDTGNTARLGSSGRPPLIAIFTQTDPVRETAGRNDFQSQNLAYSDDQGRTWTKFAENPVLANPGLRDFRDPKVFWHQAGQKWIMALAAGDHVGLYSSPDLRSWQHESDFGASLGSHAGVWECPDLVALRVEGETTLKYVLLVSVINGAPNGGSGIQYFIGDFDGHRFTPEAAVHAPDESPGEAGPAWLDWGTDDYAGVTWSGTPKSDTHPIFLGWMSNWQYAQQVPTERWRGAMTLPRSLKLIRSARGLELHSLPHPQLQMLRTAGQRVSAGAVRATPDLARGLPGSNGLLEVELDLDTRQADATVLSFENDLDERVEFRITGPSRRYELDRSRAGVSPVARFGDIQTAPRPGTATRTTLSAFVDRSSIEVFVNGGETVMTALVFPSRPLQRVSLSATSPIQLRGGSAYRLSSAQGIR